MSFLSFLNFFKRNINSKVVIQKNNIDYENTLSFWEDNYCQIEILPLENIDFIKEQFLRINNFVDKHKSAFGFDAIFERNPNPISTLSKDISIDYLRISLISLGLPQAKYIKTDSNTLIDGQIGKMKAFGYNSFAIYFDFEDGFVKSIWISISLITSVKEFQIATSALNFLGIKLNLILVDWDDVNTIDLKDETQINDYLMRMWK
jgi:hypothetical protein